MTPNTETLPEEMTAQRWFDEGGQLAELQRIGKIKNADQQKEALEQFNKRNDSFLAERGEHAQPPPLPEKVGRERKHPAIDAAIDEAIKKEKEWVQEIAGMSDEQLQDGYLERAMKWDSEDHRLDPGVVTLNDYKASRPGLVEIAGKFKRSDLERREVLSRMIQHRGFNLTAAKIEWERKQNPELVALAERNIAARRLRGVNYNDALYAEIGDVKKTMANAKAIGFKP